MIRIFEKCKLDIYFIIKTEKVHYLHNVMRCILGQELIVINGQDGEFIGEIKKITKQFIEIFIKQKTKEYQQQPFLGLIFSPIQKIDLIAKSATELGVTEFLPFKSKFCQTKFREDKFLLNMIEAVEQCERVDLPIINKELFLKEILDKLQLNNDCIVFFCEERSEKTLNLKNYNFDKNIKYYALIGCEGGFSEDEKILTKDYDFVKNISLGNNILRSETACCSILTLLNYLK